MANPSRSWLDRGPPPIVGLPLLLACAAFAIAVTAGQVPPPLQGTTGAVDVSFQRAMADGYRDGHFLPWIRVPDRLGDYMDVEAARDFAWRKLARHPVNEVNLVCAGYQLGLAPRRVKRAAHDPSWRYFWRYDPWIFCAFYLATELEPTPVELDRFRTENDRVARELGLSGEIDELEPRANLARALIALQLLGDPIPPEIQTRVADYIDRVAVQPDRSLPDRFIDQYLGTMADVPRPHEELFAFVDDGWAGYRYPNAGCGGAAYCDTKLLIQSIGALYMQQRPVAPGRAEEYLAHLVALVNDDGSIRTGLDDPRMRDVPDTIEMFHCTAFCQLDYWDFFNAMSYLVDTYDPDPARVRTLAAELRAGRVER